MKEDSVKFELIEESSNSDDAVIYSGSRSDNNLLNELLELLEIDREKAEEKLQEMLKKELIFSISKSKIKKIFSLLDNPPCDSFGLSATGAIYDIVATLLNPSTIDQDDRNLCGVDVYMRFLVKKFPEKFIDFACNLLQEGKTKIPFSIHMDSNEPESKKRSCLPTIEPGLSTLWLPIKPLLPTMMAAIRHTENALGYHPHKAFDAFFGVTFSYELFRWFKKTRVEVRYESLEVVNENFEEFSMFWQKVWTKNRKNGFYSKIHEKRDQDQIKKIEDAIQEEKFCISLISPQMKELLEDNYATYRDEDPVDETELESYKIKMLLGGQLSHYVQITHLRPIGIPVRIENKKDYPHDDKDWNDRANSREKHLNKYYLVSIEGEWRVVFYEGYEKKREFPASQVEGLSQFLENKNHPTMSYKSDPTTNLFNYCYDNDPSRLTGEDREKIKNMIQLHHDKKEKLDADVYGVEVSLETNGREFKIALMKEVFLKHFTGIMVVEGCQASLEVKATAKRQAMKELLNSQKVQSRCTDPDQIKMRMQLLAILDDDDRSATEVMEQIADIVKENSESLPLKIAKFMFCVVSPSLLFFGNPLKRSVCDEIMDAEKSNGYLL